MHSSAQKIVVFSDHFGEYCFGHSCILQNKVYYTGRLVKMRLNENAIPTILPHENPIIQQAATVKYKEVSFYDS